MINDKNEIDMTRNVFLLALTWLLALNPDTLVKWAGLAASIATVVAAISTIKKNRRK